MFLTVAIHFEISSRINLMENESIVRGEKGDQEGPLFRCLFLEHCGGGKIFRKKHLEIIPVWEKLSGFGDLLPQVLESSSS